MTRVRFLPADITVEAAPGTNLLALAQAHGQPLEGTCGGDLACATCHVVIAPADFAALPPASDAEEDMLDFAEAACATSRLSCQITLTAALATLEVRMPARS